MSEAKLRRLIELYSLEYEDAGLTIDEFKGLSGLRKDSLYPNPEIGSLCYIKNCVTNPNIIVGDYTYYDDKKGADLFEKHVTHLYDWNGDKLIIGKFCQIGSGVRSIYIHEETILKEIRERNNMSQQEMALPPFSRLFCKNDANCIESGWFFVKSKVIK